MSWVRLDDQFAHHPKVLRAGPTASFLWIACIAYCQKFLTDGFVPTRAIATICDVPDHADQAAILVSVGLLERADDGYQVHDYLAFNESAESVKRRREIDRQRKESSRNPDGIQPESGRTPTRARAPAPHPIHTYQDLDPFNVIGNQKDLNPSRKPQAAASVTDSNGNGNGNHEAPKDLAPAFMGWFLEQYKTDRGVPYFTRGERDLRAIRGLLKTVHFQRLQDLARMMLSNKCDERFIVDSERGIPILKVKVNWLNDRLASWESKNGKRDYSEAV